MQEYLSLRCSMAYIYAASLSIYASVYSAGNNFKVRYNLIIHFKYGIYNLYYFIRMKHYNISKNKSMILLIVSKLWQFCINYLVSQCYKNLRRNDIYCQPQMFRKCGLLFMALWTTHNSNILSSLSNHLSWSILQ